jgi:hypothetical protein
MSTEAGDNEHSTLPIDSSQDVSMFQQAELIVSLGDKKDKELQKKMQDLMYRLTKEAARTNYHEFLENCGISEEDYEKIKDIWGKKLGIVPYC